MNKIMRTFLIVCSALLIASIGGISALWQYSTNTVNATNIQHNITMEEFYYHENVPDDVEGGLSHYLSHLSIFLAGNVQVQFGNRRKPD